MLRFVYRALIQFSTLFLKKRILQNQSLNLCTSGLLEQTFDCIEHPARVVKNLLNDHLSDVAGCKGPGGNYFFIGTTDNEGWESKVQIKFSQIILKIISSKVFKSENEYVEANRKMLSLSEVQSENIFKLFYT